MKSKKLLFVGIALLVIGILIRKLTQLEISGLILIITGVACKTIYIISKAQSGEYKPGNELFILAIGLLLFFTGLSLRGIEQPLIKPAYLIVLGVSLKVFFIIKFVQNVKANAQPLKTAE